MEFTELNTLSVLSKLFGLIGVLLGVVYLGRDPKLGRDLADPHPLGVVGQQRQQGQSPVQGLRGLSSHHHHFLADERRWPSPAAPCRRDYE